MLYFDSVNTPKNANETKTNYKTRTSERKTTQATIFCAQKFLRGGKLFILCFDAVFTLKTLS